jgi:hypothetical protein
MVSKNKDEWINYANEIKNIRNNLINAICYQPTPKSPPLVTKKELEYLRKAVCLIDKFKDKAEDRMYNTAKIKDDTIWYGPLKNKEK